MFKDKRTARRMRDLFSDIAILIDRARGLAEQSTSTTDEKRIFSDRLSLQFDDAIASIFADIFVEHQELVLKDQGHPPGFFEKIKRAKGERDSK